MKEHLTLTEHEGVVLEQGLKLASQVDKYIVAIFLENVTEVFVVQ